jgi:flavin reductase (DIM6/NTAB) family NADH-FMN oxidoreductase RutF
MTSAESKVAADLRAFAGRFPTGVAVITVRDRWGRCFGLTANALASISLLPPLFMVSISRGSRSLAAILERRIFCINLLSERQIGLSKLFASNERDKFASVEHSISASGCPLIAGALAHAECRVTKTVESGDHTIVLGRVVRIAIHDANPLVYHRGEFTALASNRPSS